MIPPNIANFLKTTLDLDPEMVAVGEVYDGNDALEFCEIITPDIILMDLMMPNCDGITGTKIIKEKFPMVKLLVMTCSGNEDNLPKALKAGADGYFVKGIGTPKLRDAIKNTMNGVKTIEKEIYIP